MKFDKQIAIILVLVSMLLSAIAVSVYFYNEKQSVEKSNNQLVTIFVAQKDIKKDTLITPEHLKQTTIAKQYVLTRPLHSKEIVNKYAKENIYKNEAFLKEKLSTKIEVQKSKTLDYKYNSYNMSFKLFQNPNYSLEPDEIIKIISVYPKGTKKKVDDYAVQYVAKNIRVLGFLSEGHPTEKSIRKKKIKKLVKKKQVEEIVEVKAEELLLDIKEDVLLKLIDDYNKGTQLWMVKSKLEEETVEKVAEKKIEKKKIKELFKPKKVVKYAPKKKYYPIKWYQPKNISSTKTALISYEDNQELSQKKKATIVSSFSKECSKTDKLLIGLSNNIYLRNNPSFRAKIQKKVHKNYIFAYTDISKINTDWYVLCDGTYVNRKDVRVISYEEYKKLRK